MKELQLKPHKNIGKLKHNVLFSLTHTNALFGAKNFTNQTTQTTVAIFDLPLLIGWPTIDFLFWIFCAISLCNVNVLV